ncbi:hypothetical protein PAPYR_8355 [Paratrimastix pyriformis]|uniref:Uncharacterized protein n=1 Tax=Paratrimastix pyriformis TaxID=342808 RepID=A0ABQ8UFD2_9EUKA|nr:hypothetical protein PAPYR_8355 [Paratrimastix pyriformis]
MRGTTNNRLLIVALLAASFYCLASARTLVAENVCFAGKNRGFGGLRVPYAIGGIVQLVLVARSGGISCDTANYQPTYWGCPWLAGGLSVMITDANTGATATSPELRFDMPRATALSAGQQLRIWYGEDLYGLFEGDNGGVTCADLYADTEDAPGGPGPHPGGPLGISLEYGPPPPTVTFGLELDQRPDLTNPACAGFLPEIRDCFGETTTGGTLVTEGYLVAVIRVAGQPQAYWAWKTRIVIDPVSQASSTYMSLNTGPAIGVTIPTPSALRLFRDAAFTEPRPLHGDRIDLGTTPRLYVQHKLVASAVLPDPSVLLNLRVLKARLLAMPSDGSPADLSVGDTDPSVRRLFAGSEVVQQPQAGSQATPRLRAAANEGDEKPFEAVTATEYMRGRVAGADGGPGDGGPRRGPAELMRPGIGAAPAAPLLYRPPPATTSACNTQASKECVWWHHISM